MRFRRRQHSSSAFTLVELTIVVVMLGILATMAVPRVGKTVENTKVDQGVVGMQSIWLAQRRYRLQHESFAPSISVLVKDGFLHKRYEENESPFLYGVKKRGKDGLLITARRDPSSGWKGELKLDERGRIQGQVINGGGDVVKP